MASRDEVYAAIDTERAYQDDKWTPETTTSDGVHTLGEWLGYILDYTLEANKVQAREAKQAADPKTLDIIRKIAAMGVAAMEQHGAPHRQRAPKPAALDNGKVYLPCGCSGLRCGGHEARPYHRIVGQD